MGFRNPITTAEAVDTGHGQASAGVRLFQDLSNPSVPQGVAEWRTGLMDRNARITLAGGGSGGSSFFLDGGATEGVPAATLGLGVESAPAGGYQSVARLTAAGGFYVNGQAWARPRAFSIPRQSASLSDSFPSGPFTVLINGTITAAPPGDYLIILTLVLSGSVAAGGNAQLVVNTADVLSSPRSDVVPQAQPNSWTYALTNYAGGDLALVGTQLLASGTGTIYTRGSAITAAYLGPRS